MFLLSCWDTRIHSTDFNDWHVHKSLLFLRFQKNFPYLNQFMSSIQKIGKAFNNENRRADFVVKSKIKSNHSVISQNLLLDLYYMKVFWLWAMMIKGGGIEFTGDDMVVDIESAGLPDLGSRSWIDTYYTYLIKTITVHLRKSYSTFKMYDGIKLLFWFWTWAMVLKKESVSKTASKLKVDERLLFAESDLRAEPCCG